MPTFHGGSAAEHAESADAAVQDKLNSIADVLADLMAALAHDNRWLRQDTAELRAAVGLEDRESA